jgi:hypothetical protein
MHLLPHQRLLHTAPPEQPNQPMDILKITDNNALPRAPIPGIDNVNVAGFGHGLR